jgi:general secretion pathway protein B
MSFILDALKKSEAERARQSGPTLVDPRIVPPRHGMPGWMIVLGVVLVANLVVLAIVLARGGHRTGAGTADGTTTPPAVTSSAAPAPVQSEPAPVNALPPPVLPPAAAPQAPAGTVLPSVDYGGRQAAIPPAPEPETLPSGRLITPVSGAAPAAASAATRPPAAPRQDPSGLPTAEDLRVSGISLPALNMALHAWDALPSNRYVLLNGQKLREGQQTSEGVLVEQITADGAVLSWRDRRFVLTPGD